MKKLLKIISYGIFSVLIISFCTSIMPIPETKQWFKAVDAEPFALVFSLEKLYRTQKPTIIQAHGLVNEKGLWSVEVFTNKINPKIHSLENTKKWSGSFFPILAIQLNNFFLKEEIGKFEGVAKKDSKGVWQIHLSYEKKAQPD